jgi:hypothetical protein
VCKTYSNQLEMGTLAFERCNYDHEGGGLMNDISALIKEAMSTRCGGICL